MDLLSYRGITMRVIQSLPHIRAVELDESRATYLWTRLDLSFIVTLEPTALSAVQATFLNNSSTPPTVKNAADIQAGDPLRTMPATTDVAIRRFLEYPRGTLIVQGVSLTNDPTNPLNVLTSPAPGMPCDANNGPFCKVNSIQEVAGERLWQIHLTFTTFIYEDSLSTGGTPPILQSNRWMVTTDTNELHLTDRIIDGVVHFRADQLITDANQTSPGLADFYRKVFAAFTVPSGFKRVRVTCSTLPQGNAVRYRIIDREQPYQQQSGPQVRLEYVERSWMWRGSAGRFFAQTGSSFFAQLPIIPGPWNAYGWANVRGFTQDTLNNLGKNLPKRYKTVIARAWGNRFSDRALIVTSAMILAQARMGQPNALLPYTSESVVSYHSTQMMAQVEQTINWSFNDAIPSPTQTLNLGSLIFGGGTLGVGDAGFAGFAGATGDSIHPAAGLVLQLEKNAIQPPFPAQNQTHGTWASPQFDPNYLARQATQTLETIGQAPAAPP